MAVALHHRERAPATELRIVGAYRELRADPDLDSRERADLLAWAEAALDKELNGDESTEELRDIVNDILDEAFADEDEPNNGDSDFDEDDEDADNDSEFD